MGRVSDWTGIIKRYTIVPVLQRVMDMVPWRRSLQNELTKCCKNLWLLGSRFLFLYLRNADL